MTSKRRAAHTLPIAALAIGVRAYGCLTRAGLITVGDVVNRTPFELLKIHHLGRKTLVQIHEALAKEGLSLRRGAKASERELFDEMLSHYGHDQ